MQDPRSMPMFKATTRDHSLFKGSSIAFVTYCYISCFVKIVSHVKNREALGVSRPTIYDPKLFFL